MANANFASHSEQLPHYAHTTMPWGLTRIWRLYHQDLLVLHGVLALQLDVLPDCLTYRTQVLPRANVHLQPFGEALVCEERNQAVESPMLQ